MLNRYYPSKSNVDLWDDCSNTSNYSNSNAVRKGDIYYDIQRSQSFNAQAETIWRALRLSSGESEDLKSLLRDIRKCLHNIWPGCEIKLFGSLVTGLIFKDSDVDVIVELPLHGQDDTEVCFMKIMVHVAWEDTGFEYVFSAPQATVPIINLKHVESNKRCDISFTGHIALETSKLIKFLLRFDSRAFKLAVLVKYWSKIYKLTSSKQLPNYAVTLLLIFFLQRKKILPSVISLQRNVPRNDTAGWNTAFNHEPNYECQSTESLYQLLGEFFVYYRDFNYEDFVVCTYLGYPVKKPIFNNPIRLRSGREWFFLNSCLSVQDPFEHNRNCTYNVGRQLVRKIFKSFDTAAYCYESYQSYEFLKSLVLKANKPVEVYEPAYELNGFPQFTITDDQIPQNGRSWYFYLCSGVCFLTLYLILSPRI